MHVAELLCLAVVQHKNGCRFAGLNDIPSGRLFGLSLMAYGEGTLDEEEFCRVWVLRSVVLANIFASPQEIPVRPLLVLDGATLLSRLRFTQPQVESSHGALAAPADFVRTPTQEDAHLEGLSTRIEECMQIPTRTVNERLVLFVKRSCFVRAPANVRYESR